MRMSRKQLAVLGVFLLVSLAGKPALTSELRGWGGDYANQVTDAPLGSDFIAAAAGDEHVSLRSTEDPAEKCGLRHLR